MPHFMDKYDLVGIIVMELNMTKENQSSFRWVKCQVDQWYFSVLRSHISMHTYPPSFSLSLLILSMYTKNVNYLSD